MEKLLQYVWKQRILPLRALFSSDGKEIEIINPGLPNYDSGPDFFNAKVRIDGTMWAGNVEIHLKSSDWFRHGHETDEAYNNVILHVVNVVDCPVRTQSGKEITQLQLDIPAQLRVNYEELLKPQDYPPCHEIVGKVDTFLVHSWMDYLLCERQEARAKAISKRLAEFDGDWERTFFVSLARNFGFGLNGDAFEAWAKLIPLSKIAKHRDDLFQIEAIFLGTAGLIDRAKDMDDYGERLRKEYEYQRRLFSLPDPMPKAQWKYLRLRPQNFPHIRLAELAWMYCEGRVSMSSMLDCMKKDEPLKALYKLLSAKTSDYWTTHLTMGKPVEKKRLTLSRSTQQLLITNTVVPVLFAYSLAHGDEVLKAQLYDILLALPAEDNRILRLWKDCGISVENAADSQALIELKLNYCDRSDCLRCSFGYEYLKRRL
ncbi:MAG: DUF2851 family protein [Prevotellaceae bacterium]|nr:DUF2851 family protein [Prevotellaceae bacterium]